jgi:ankyrin repeat protein
MLMAYRRFQRALRDRDTVALAALVRDHPEWHDGGGRIEPLRRIADAGTELLRAAFEAGLSPDAGEPTGQTFLQSAAADGQVDVVALCLEFGADLERRNDRGETALGYACSWGHLAVVRLPVEAGADVNAVERDPEDGFSNTALDSARSHPDIEACLRAAGAKRFGELQEG